MCHFANSNLLRHRMELMLCKYHSLSKTQVAELSSCVQMHSSFRALIKKTGYNKSKKVSVTMTVICHRHINWHELTYTGYTKLLNRYYCWYWKLVKTLTFNGYIVTLSNYMTKYHLSQSISLFIALSITLSQYLWWLMTIDN